MHIVKLTLLDFVTNDYSEQAAQIEVTPLIGDSREPLVNTLAKGYTLTVDAPIAESPPNHTKEQSMPSIEPTPAQTFFNSRFAAYQRELHGTEQEIAVFKQMAWNWFLVGRSSMVEEMRTQAIRQLDAADEMARQLGA